MAAEAKRMTASARPARFGRGEQTLLHLGGRASLDVARRRTEIAEREAADKAAGR
jgi:hypothetical protein